MKKHNFFRKGKSVTNKFYTLSSLIKNENQNTYKIKFRKIILCFKIKPHKLCIQ